MIVDIVIATTSILCAAYVWSRVGRQKAFDDLLQDYKQQAKVVQLQEILIEGYKQKYGELTDKQNDKETSC